MSTIRPVDHRAIMLRYLSWRGHILNLVAIFMFVLPQLPIADGEALRDKAYRLGHAAQFADDPQVRAEAQRQLTPLEAGPRYRFRSVIQFGPIVVGFLLLIPSFRTSFKAARAVRRARQGQCMGCGYDLQGSGYQNACPECATPPAPLKSDRSKRAALRMLGKRVVMPAMTFGAFGVFLYFSSARSIGPLLGIPKDRRVMSALGDAPRVLVRWVRVVDDGGSWQYAFFREPGSGLVRQEWWEQGELQDAIVLPVDPGCERYLPATGVTERTLGQVRARRLDEHEMFNKVQLGQIASAQWYESEQIASGPPYDIYRRVTPSGLHDHHAMRLEINVIDSSTRRPLYRWTGTFDEVLDPDAVPTLRQLWITEIEYPETSPGPEIRRLDKTNPGVLRVDWPINPRWLDEAWVNPVLDD